MKQTAYERQKAFVTPTIAQARKEIDKLPARELLLKLFNIAMETKTPDPTGLIVSLPFALAERACVLCKDPFVWEEFATTEPMEAMATFDLEIGRLVHRQEEALNMAWVSTSLINLWQYQCHRLAGERVYELSPGLGERLLHTELKGLDTDDLRLPYRSIYLVVPAELGLELMNEKTGAHQLEGVYITEYEHDGMRKWKLLFWGPPNAASQNEHDDTLFHFSVELPAGMPLEEALESSELFRKAGLANGTETARKYYLDQWRKLFALVMNTVVYCTWPDAELRQIQNPEFTKLQEQMKKHPKGSHKYERTKEKLRETAQQRRVLLGASQKPLKNEPTRGDLTGPLTVRTLVAGHWKRQPYGEGRALRKWIHIAPFWRGPEGAPESNPRRVLEGA